MEKIIKELSKEAKRLNCCREGFEGLLSACDITGLCHLYIRHIDFCFEHDFPSKDYIKATFGKETSKHGIYVDEDIEVCNQGSCIALGSSKGSVLTSDYGVSEIHARHDSNLKVIAKGNAFVMVDVYDDAVVDVCAYDRAKVCVNKHGGNVTYNATDDAVVKLRDKSNK